MLSFFLIFFPTWLWVDLRLCSMGALLRVGMELGVDLLMIPIGAGRLTTSS